MAAPADRRYTQTHEWHKPEGDLVVIGISKFAVEELTDITYLEFKKPPGSAVRKGEVFGEVESVKATSELYCGIDGTVAEVNQAAADNPVLLNEDPYEKGWLIKIKPADPAQLNALMSAQDYDAQHV